jgi:hypothetical protein
MSTQTAAAGNLFACSSSSPPRTFALAFLRARLHPLTTSPAFPAVRSDSRVRSHPFANLC